MRMDYHTFALATLISLSLCAGEKSLCQAPSPDALTLKDQAGSLLFATSTGYDGPGGIIKGPNVEQNRRSILQHFNTIQPAVYPAWGGFWPPEKPERVEDFTFWTEPLAAQANWAAAHDLRVIHHSLFAPNYYFPDWWRSSDYSPEELEIILKQFVEAVVSVEHVDVFNLFNELFLGDGSYFPNGDGEWDNKWLGLGMEPDASGLTGDARVNEAHPRFIRIALEHAAAHTTAKLELREGTTFQNPRKLDALYQLVLHLQKSGAPIHALGIQGHLDYNEQVDFNAFHQNVGRFRDRGLEFYITELDVGLPRGEDPDRVDWTRVEPAQAEMYYKIVTAARKASVDLISVWGLRDTPKGGWRGGERALLFDGDFQKKASYHGVLRALSEPHP